VQSTGVKIAAKPTSLNAIIQHRGMEIHMSFPVANRISAFALLLMSVIAGVAIADQEPPSGASGDVLLEVLGQ